MFEYRAVWNVTGGGVGYSVFHVREGVTPDVETAANAFATDLRAGLVTLGGDLPNDVSITFESEARELDIATGTLIDVHPVTAPAAVTGVQTGTYAAPAGARVDLITSSIVNSRRLKGHTFIVPLAATSYADNGQVSSSARGRLTTAFEMFRDELDMYSLAVWSRTHGVLADVISVTPDVQAAILRSRRE